MIPRGLRHPRAGLRALGAIAAVAALAFLAPAPVAAADQGGSDVRLDHLHADYRLGLDPSGRARLAVTETIAAEFPDDQAPHELVRVLPLRRDGVDLRLEVTGVTNGDGAGVAYRRTDRDGLAALTIEPGLVRTGLVLYRIAYTLQDVVTLATGGAGDEFRWDVNGTDWPQPFYEVSATVHLDPRLQSAAIGGVACSASPVGATDMCTATGDGAEFAASTSYVLAHQTLTIAVPLAAGAVTMPDDDAGPAVAAWTAGGLALLLLAASAVVLVLRRRRSDVAAAAAGEGDPLEVREAEAVAAPRFVLPSVVPPGFGGDPD